MAGYLAVETQKQDILYILNNSKVLDGLGSVRGLMSVLEYACKHRQDPPGHDRGLGTFLKDCGKILLLM